MKNPRGAGKFAKEKTRHLIKVATNLSGRGVSARIRERHGSRIFLYHTDLASPTASLLVEKKVNHAQQHTRQAKPNSIQVKQKTEQQQPSSKQQHGKQTTAQGED